MSKLVELGVEGLEQETQERIATIHTNYIIGILTMFLVCCGVCMYLQDKCNERVINERNEARFSLATFCGKVSGENERFEPIVIKPFK